MIADRAAIAVGRDKWRTFEFMRENGLPCAASALPEEEKEGFVREFGFPLVVKPREGHGSLQVYVVHDEEELRASLAAISWAGWRPMLQEYLRDGDEEFTSGVTVNLEGTRVMSSISMRRTLKNGQTYRAFIDDFPEVRRAAEQVALRLRVKGPLNVQARLSAGQPKAFVFSTPASPRRARCARPWASTSPTSCSGTGC